MMNSVQLFLSFRPKISDVTTLCTQDEPPRPQGRAQLRTVPGGVQDEQGAREPPAGGASGQEADALRGGGLLVRDARQEDAAEAREGGQARREAQEGQERHHRRGHGGHGGAVVEGAEVAEEEERGQEEEGADQEKRPGVTRRVISESCPQQQRELMLAHYLLDLMIWVLDLLNFLFLNLTF